MEVETPTTDDRQTAEEEAQAFEAGYGEDGPIAVPTPETDDPEASLTEESPSGSTEPSEPTEPADPETPTPQAAPTLTSEQIIEQRLASLNDTFRRQIDTAFGKMGGLERTIRELKEAKGQAMPLSGELSIDDFKDLADEYPEVAEAIRKGLNQGLKRVLAAAPPTQAPTEPSTAPPAQPNFVTKDDLERWQQESTERISTDVDRKNAARFMDYLAPDWKSVVGGPNDNTAYRQWLATQPEAYQKELADTWDPVVIHRSIQQFEQSKKASQTPAPASSSPKPKEKPNLFRAAVPVKGTGTAERGRAVTEEEAFLEGFDEK